MRRQHTPRICPALLLCLALAACERATGPGTPVARSLQPAVAPSGAVHVANPACTHHWRNVDPDWFADTNWVELTAPGANSSVCIDLAPLQAGPMITEGRSATIQALTINGGGVSLGNSAGGATLNVALDVDVAADGELGLASGSLLNVGQVVHIAGAIGASGTPAPAVIRGDVDLQSGGSLRLFGGNVVMDKVNLSLVVNGGFTSPQFCGCGIDIPASTLAPTVVVNGGAIGPINLNAGSLTLNGGTMDGVVLADADLSLGAGPFSLGSVTMRPPAGGNSTLTGNIVSSLPSFSPVITVEGAGPGTTATLQLIGDVVNAGVINLVPGNGAVLNLTGTGTLTNQVGLYTNVAAAGAVHVQVNLNSPGGLAWEGATFLDKSGGTYTFSNQLAGTTGATPLVVSNGATMHITPGANVGGDLDVSAAHLILESNVAGVLRNLASSTVDLGSGYRDLGLGGYTQDATSGLALKVGGAVPGISMDRLRATDFSLDGSLTVNTVSPFIGGVCGQLPQIMSAGTNLTSTFATVNGLLLAPTRSWGLLTLSNEVRLRGFNPLAKLSLEPNPVALAEGGAAANYQLCLSQQPTAAVTVSFAADAQVFGQNQPIGISPANWYQPLVLLITASDDNVVEPQLHTGQMNHTATSADPFYSGASGILTANITDNDGNADLALSITAAPPPVFLNQNFSVSFRARDIGPTLSTGATFSVPANPAFRVVGTTGTTCAPAGGNLLCTIPGVAAGGQANFTLTLKPVQRGTFSFAMTLTGQQPDPNTANNVLTRNITVN